MRDDVISWREMVIRGGGFAALGFLLLQVPDQFETPVADAVLCLVGGVWWAVTLRHVLNRGTHAGVSRESFLLIAFCLIGSAVSTVVSDRWVTYTLLAALLVADPLIEDRLASRYPHEIPRKHRRLGWRRVA
jgi:hypothetical protein